MPKAKKRQKPAPAPERAFLVAVTSLVTLFACTVIAVTFGASVREPESARSVAAELADTAVLEARPNIEESGHEADLPPGAAPAGGKLAGIGSPTAIAGSRVSGKDDLPPPRKGKLVIIIDDVGWNTKDVDQWLKIPGPITFAILPGHLFSEKALAMIRASGKDYILHQPMEAITDFDPGEGAIYGMTTPAEAIAIVERNLALLPGAKGINHHMGSLVSQDPAIMAAVLQVAKRHDIYYVDSFTIRNTAVPAAAKAIGMPYWERDVFLDNTQDRESIVKYLNEGMRIAEKRGYAVMIGHVWSAELAQTLFELYPQLIEQGFSLATISQIMLEDGNAGSGD